MLEQHQPGGRAAELAGHAERVAGARRPARPTRSLGGGGVPDRGDADRERRRGGQVAAEHGDPDSSARLGEAVAELEASRRVPKSAGAPSQT